MAQDEKSSRVQYLTFKMDQEIFALDVSIVREVLELSEITKVPRSPDYLLGVINVRGSVVPVADLRTRFGLPRIDSTVFSRIIVMELFLDGETTVMGALADSVHDVIELSGEEIGPAPKMGSRWRNDFIRGIARREDQFVIVLDIERVFSTEEAAMVEEAVE